jgi:hypothetical protein
MSEKRNERVPVSTGLTLDQWLAKQKQAAEAPQQAANVLPPQFNPQVQPQFQYPPQFQPQYAPPRQQPDQGLIADRLAAARVETSQPSPNRQRSVKKIVGFALAGLVVAGAAGYGLNVGNVQAMMSFADTTPDHKAGLAITPLETLGEKSLAPNQCKDPNAVLMVATVSGNLPLVPLLATTENATPTKAAPYLTEAKKASLPKAQQQKIGNFITKSGYPEATLNNIPLALTICEPTSANAITEQGGALTINRSALEINFEDPNGLFGTNIFSVPQVDSATVTKIDPKKSEFMSLPNPINNMFLGEGTDAVYNKSITDMMTSMNDPKQLQVILSKMEVEAIQDVDNVVDGHANITYPDNADTLQQAIDQALVKRLIGNTKTAPIFTGNYNVQMDVPKNAATKQPVTSNDPTTGASPLKNIDPTQKFRITNIDIKYGSISPPAVIPKPSPTPTPSATPTTTP